MKYDERKPDKTERIQIGEHSIVVDTFGCGDEVLLCLNGGPGLPCDYVRDCHSWLSDRGYRVVAFDQLGCGRSDRPDDTSLWNVDRYTQEIEQVRQALGLGPFHLLGQSWGTFMTTEYTLKYPQHVKSIILANGITRSWLNFTRQH